MVNQRLAGTPVSAIVHKHFVLTIFEPPDCDSIAAVLAITDRQKINLNATDHPLSPSSNFFELPRTQPSLSETIRTANAQSVQPPTSCWVEYCAFKRKKRKYFPRRELGA
jgi:hypothetical protein